MSNDKKQWYRVIVLVSAIVLILLVLPIMLIGCASQQVKPLTPVDVAAESGKQVSKAFLMTYSVAEEWTDSGIPYKHDYAINVLNPKINKAKLLIVDFDRLVAHWQRTGESGDDVIAKQKEVEAIYDEIQKIIINVLTDERGW